MIRIHSPATGELVGEVPDLDAAAVGEAVARARAAAPAWAALDLGERVEALLAVAGPRPRHAARARDAREGERQAAPRGGGDRGPLPVRAHPGDDAPLAPGLRRGDPEPAPLPHEEDPPRAASARRRGRHRALELSDPEQRGRRRRASSRGQHGRSQAVRDHAAHVVSSPGPLGEGGKSAGRLPGRHGTRRGGGRARGSRGRRHVHGLGRDGAEDRRALRRAPRSVRARARRQVAIRRPPGREPRTGRRGGRVVELHPLGPGLRPDGAHLRARLGRGTLRGAPRRPAWRRSARARRIPRAAPTTSAP